MTLADSDVRTRLGSCASQVDLAQLFERSMTALPFLPREGTAQGYRIFSLNGTELGYCDLAEGSHVVIGRHSLADVVLHAPSTALRQIVLWTTRHRGELVLRGHNLIDGTPIRNGTGLDGQRAKLQRLALWVGGEPVVVLPDIGIVPKDELHHAPAAMETRSMVRHAGSNQAPWLQVTLTGPGGVRRLQRSYQALERGLLVGRYSRCENAGDHVFSDGVSRVHALIVRDEEGVLVLDLQSTNGLQMMGRAVRRVRVSSHAVIQMEELDSIEVVVNGP